MPWHLNKETHFRPGWNFGHWVRLVVLPRKGGVLRKTKAATRIEWFILVERRQLFSWDEQMVEELKHLINQLILGRAWSMIGCGGLSLQELFWWSLFVCRLKRMKDNIMSTSRKERTFGEGPLLPRLGYGGGVMLFHFLLCLWLITYLRSESGAKLDVVSLSLAGWMLWRSLEGVKQMLSFQYDILVVLVLNGILFHWTNML